MKKNKIIINIGTKKEKILYFDNYTKKILDILLNNNYILLYYDNFFKKYINYDYRLNEKQKKLFNNNIDLYSY